MNCQNVCGIAESTPDTAYSKAQKNKTRRRPQRSLINPAVMAPGIQPRIADAVASPIRSESRFGSRLKWSWSSELAPLITAVS